MHNTNPFRRTHHSQQEPSQSSHSSNQGQNFQPPPGPPPSSTSVNQGQAPVRPPPQYHDSPNYDQGFEAPSGPPPTWKGDMKKDDTSDFVAPSGPPPTWQGDMKKHDTSGFAPPPGPPPSHAQEQSEAGPSQPPAYDSWMSVPDTSTLPPPPSFGYDDSPAANASPEAAESARLWCRFNPLYDSRALSQGEIAAIDTGDITLLKPPTVPANISSSKRGNYRVQTRPGCDDGILLTNLPLYCASRHWVPRSGPRTIYFEIRVLRMGGNASSTSEADAGIAIGFVSPPYPPFRLPGWERSSLGVHGDDGRRYMCDNKGGKDFTTSFRNGEVVGIGMHIKPHPWQQGAVSVEAFFTREGRKEGSWDVNEERDAEEEGDLEGLKGGRDIFGAIGFFGSVDFEVRFRRDEWLFRP